MPDFSNLAAHLPPGVLQKAIDAAIDATARNVKRIEASTPGLSTLTLATWVGRVSVLVFGGYLLRWGIDISKWTGEDWVAILGVLTIVGGGGWSLLQQQIRARREHQIALASAAASAKATAELGRPVEVPVQPPPAKV